MSSPTMGMWGLPRADGSYARHGLPYAPHLDEPSSRGDELVGHSWRLEENSNGTWGWSCTCGWEGDEYPDRDGAEDAAEIHVEREEGR